MTNICSTAHSRIDVGVIRGTIPDPDGNITMEREALTLESPRDRDGRTQFRRRRDCTGRANCGARITPNSRQVKIPGILVDCVVIAEKAEYHMQTFGEAV